MYPTAPSGPTRTSGADVADQAARVGAQGVRRSEERYAPQAQTERPARPRRPRGRRESSARGMSWRSASPNSPSGTFWRASASISGVRVDADDLVAEGRQVGGVAPGAAGGVEGDADREAVEDLADDRLLEVEEAGPRLVRRRPAVVALRVVIGRASTPSPSPSPGARGSPCRRGGTPGRTRRRTPAAGRCPPGRARQGAGRSRALLG